MLAAAAGCQAGMDAASVRDDSDAVSGRERHLAEAEGGVDHAVQFGAIAGTSAQQSPAVHHDPDRLAAFRLIDPGYRTAAPRRHGPANVTGFIAGLVVAK